MKVEKKESIGMLFGCCLPAAQYDLLMREGYDSITLSAAEIAEMPEQALRELCARVQGGTLICRDTNAFCKPHIKLAGPDYSADKLRAYAQPLLERAEQLSIHSMGVGSPLSRLLPDDFDREKAREQFHEALLLLSALAKPHGIRILLEAISTAEGNFITTTQEALTVLADLPARQVGIVYDIYHAAMMREDLCWIAEAASHIEMVHISQDISGRRCYLRADYMDTYRAYAAALDAAGYAGTVSIEAMDGNPEDELAQSLAILRRVWG